MNYFTNIQNKITDFFTTKNVAIIAGVVTVGAILPALVISSKVAIVALVLIAIVGVAVLGLCAYQAIKERFCVENQTQVEMNKPVTQNNKQTTNDHENVKFEPQINQERKRQLEKKREKEDAVFIIRHHIDEAEHFIQDNKNDLNCYEQLHTKNDVGYDEKVTHYQNEIKRLEECIGTENKELEKAQSELEEAEKNIIIMDPEN